MLHCTLHCTVSDSLYRMYTLYSMHENIHCKQHVIHCRCPVQYYVIHCKLYYMIYNRESSIHCTLRCTLFSSLREILYSMFSIACIVHCTVVYQRECLQKVIYGELELLWNWYVFSLKLSTNVQPVQHCILYNIATFYHHIFGLPIYWRPYNCATLNIALYGVAYVASTTYNTSHTILYFTTLYYICSIVYIVYCILHLL